MAGPPAVVTATKVTPPRPPRRYLGRARLVDRLEESVRAGRGVVLVSAPAGSGKSTLVNGWLDGRPGQPAWLQVDEGDDDPARFWTYVSAALADTAPVSPASVADALAAGLDEVVDVMVNTIAATGDEIVLVIDDYHLVTNPDVHTSVERLIGLRPTNLTVVLVTRFDPPIRLGRLRVRDELTEVRADDLRFDDTEAGWLLDADNVGLDHDAVARLRQRTEGWAAGLVLASLSLRDGVDLEAFVDSFHGDDQLVADYLGEEFLDSLDDADLERLLDASVLDRMSGPLLDAVTGSSDGAIWLQALASTNQLVIALDRTGTWFRFHHLLRDVLRVELERRDPTRRAELHAAAGHAFEEQGDYTAAVEHLLAAGARVEAADLVANHATMLLNVGRSYTVSRYIEQLSDLLDSHQGLAIVHGWLSFVMGRFAEAKQSLATAKRLDTDGVEAGLIQSLTGMIHLAEGDVAGGLAAIRDDVPMSDPTHPMVLGGIRVMAGLFDDAVPYLRTANEMAATRPDHFVAAVTPVFEAVAAIETGRSDAARTLADGALAYADDRRLSELAQVSLAHSIVARTSDGELAVDAAARGVQLARRSPENVMLTYALASAADVGFAHERPEAEEWLAEARSIVNRCVDPGIAGRYLGRVEARHGRAERPAVDGQVEELTERELSVLRYLPSTLSQREIAAELYVSLNTVKTHSKSIYRKLGVDGRKAAVQVARDNGLL
ncbi:LuxR family maltose regulon positive regulatory protein [Ilumatobacter fluminis]|uniref:LuxR family maltose regulon positive regulatory protein n=1 Tax=Ilumatobacter fluminis TaxID=467091 RepID=A0A4R7HVG3_9ACTN|nr:LuxR C-terminal-related transcriptional regulator [Ilumatobacter fluminis]TDT14971.1 LuxR family maltose regulon positive regulatory protein [Ilumatobacter fluminis]